MRARAYLVATVGVVAACGRLGFEPSTRSGTDATAADGRAIDAFDLDPGRCGIGATAPDPIEVSGEVVYYTDFTGDFEGIAGASVALHSGSPTGELLDSGVTDGSGEFEASLVTHGVAQYVVGTVTKTGYFTTTGYDDLRVDRSVSGARAQIISGGAMASVYSDGSSTIDPSAGTLFFTAADCAGNPIAGVSFSIEPPPASVFYEQADGSTGGNATTLPYGVAVACNAQPTADTRIDVSRDGVLQFSLPSIFVAPGDAVTSLVVHLP